MDIKTVFNLGAVGTAITFGGCVLLPFLITVPGAAALATPGIGFIPGALSFYAPIFSIENWASGLEFWGGSAMDGTEAAMDFFLA